MLFVRAKISNVFFCLEMSVPNGALVFTVRTSSDSPISAQCYSSGSYDCSFLGGLCLFDAEPELALALFDVVGERPP